MNGSPITAWEGAEAYFTFADSPGILAIILILAVAATFGTILYGGKHEAEAYRAKIPE
jgi:hypothetical protein